MKLLSRYTSTVTTLYLQACTLCAYKHVPSVLTDLCPSCLRTCIRTYALLRSFLKTCALRARKDWSSVHVENLASVTQCNVAAFYPRYYEEADIRINVNDVLSIHQVAVISIIYRTLCNAIQTHTQCKYIKRQSLSSTPVNRKTPPLNASTPASTGLSYPSAVDPWAVPYSVSAMPSSAHSPVHSS
jgi:hypothetical protein